MPYNSCLPTLLPTFILHLRNPHDYLLQFCPQTGVPGLKTSRLIVSEGAYVVFVNQICN